MEMKYKLPDGRETKSRKVYSREWQKLCKLLKKYIGIEVRAFEPTIIVIDKEPRGNQAIVIPAWLAKRLFDAAVLMDEDE